MEFCHICETLLGKYMFGKDYKSNIIQQKMLKNLIILYLMHKWSSVTSVTHCPPQEMETRPIFGNIANLTKEP